MPPLNKNPGYAPDEWYLTRGGRTRHSRHMRSPRAGMMSSHSITPCTFVACGIRVERYVVPDLTCITWLTLMAKQALARAWSLFSVWAGVWPVGVPLARFVVCCYCLGCCSVLIAWSPLSKPLTAHKESRFFGYRRAKILARC